jgi:hypothetical protein
MEIQYQCELRDYEEILAAQRKQSANDKIVRTFIALLVLILAAVSVYVLFGITLAPALLAAWAGLFGLALLVKGIRSFWIKRDFLRHPNFSRPSSARIDENGLHVEAEVSTSDTKWPAYTKYQETQNLFLLYVGARLIQAIPKRALSGEQVDEFRQLVRMKLKPKNC